MKKEDSLIEPLSGRDALGASRLLCAADGDRWLDKRNVSMLPMMVRAGLRVGEIVNLHLDNITLQRLRAHQNQQGAQGAARSAAESSHTPLKRLAH